MVTLYCSSCSYYRLFEKNEIPKGFSEQSYQDFTKVYSDYQKAKKTNSEDEKGLANLADYHEKKTKEN